MLRWFRSGTDHPVALTGRAFRGGVVEPEPVRVFQNDDVVTVLPIHAARPDAQQPIYVSVTFLGIAVRTKRVEVEVCLINRIERQPTPLGPDGWTATALAFR